MVTAQAGSLMFRLIVPGLSAHGCVREEGVSAVEKFLPLFSALRRLEAERCGVADGRAAVRGRPLAPRCSRATACRGRSRSARCAPATGPRACPTRLVAEGRYGVAVGEEPCRGPAGVRRSDRPRCRGRSLAREHPPKVEWWGGRFDPARHRPGRPDRRRRRRARRRPSRRRAAARGRHLRRGHAPAGQRRRHPDRPLRPRRRARRAHGRRVRADRRAARGRADARSSPRCASAASRSRLGRLRPPAPRRTVMPLPEGYIAAPSRARRGARDPGAPRRRRERRHRRAAPSRERRRHRVEERRSATPRRTGGSPSHRTARSRRSPGSGRRPPARSPPTTTCIPSTAAADSARRCSTLSRRARAELPSRTSDGAARRLVVWCEDSDAERRASLDRRGFAAVRQYFEMAIDLSRRSPGRRSGRRTSSPAAFARRTMTAVYLADQEAFAEHHLYEPRDYDEWRLFHLEAPGATSPCGGWLGTATSSSAS